MTRHGALFLPLLILAMGVPAWPMEAGAVEKKAEKGEIRLPAPRLDGPMSLEKAIQGRRSVRGFSDEALTLSGLSQLLWAAYGITKPLPDGPVFLRGGLRAAPSAGGLYPLEIYVVAGRVSGLAAGIYRYVSEQHALVLLRAGDLRQDLCQAALGQDWIRQAPAAIVYAAVFERTTKKYGSRGRDRYVCMDAGHSSENVYLQARALGLGCCIAGAFDDDRVKQVLGLAAAEEPLCILAVGESR
jgi:SagB-type dehydrogenase family enzyme